VGLGRNIWRETPRPAVSRPIRARDYSDRCVSNISPVSAKTHLNPGSESGLPRNRLLLHGFLTVLVPYIHTRLRNNAMSNAWPEAPSSDRRRKIWDWMTSIESTHMALSLVSFVVFLGNGRYMRFPQDRSMVIDYFVLCRYRTLADRLLQMRLSPARRLIKRNVSYEFMNRQMVWHAFTVSAPTTFMTPHLSLPVARNS
jgi:peroxin-2